MGLVRHDAADFRAREDDVVGPFGIEKIFDGLLIAEIEFGMRPFQDVGVAFSFELADAGAADHAAVAADEDFSIFVDHHTIPQNPIS